MIFALGLALAGPSTLAAGGDHTCAIDADGSLKCWGKDRDDFLNEIPSGTFLDVDVEAGLGCAVDTRGQLTCWGRDDYGQSSNAPTTARNVQVDWSFGCSQTRGSSSICSRRSLGRGG